jgi:hypothetical protein
MGKIAFGRFSRFHGEGFALRADRKDIAVLIACKGWVLAMLAPGLRYRFG